MTIAPGIRLTAARLADYDVRGAVLEGSRRVVVWDTLSAPADMRGVLPALEGRDLVVVYSHADWDHVWGTGGLPHATAAIVAHAHAALRFAADVPVTLSEKRRAEPGRWDDVVLVAPTTTFESTSSIDLGGLTLDLVHLPGHTPDCLVGFVREHGMLLAGDTVETPLPVIPAGAPLDAWIAGLEGWAVGDGVRLVVPAHGPLGGRELLARTIEYLCGIRDGHPVEPREPLTPFYRDTHAVNVSWRPPA